MSVGESVDLVKWVVWGEGVGASGWGVWMSVGDSLYVRRECGCLKYGGVGGKGTCMYPYGCGYLCVDMSAFM